MAQPLERAEVIVVRRGLGTRVGRPVIRFVRGKPLGAFGAALVLMMGLAAILAPFITFHDPYTGNYADAFSAPGAKYWLGTDQAGRDIFTRIVYGARTALLVGFGASFLGCTFGALFGVVSAYFGGKVDIILQRILDAIMGFPLLVLALAIVTVLGPSITNVIIAITFPIMPRAARVVRSTALSIKENQYIDAARAVGASDARIILLHMLPNTVAPYLIILTAQLGVAILTEASLSFLGVGLAEPTPSWGLMLSGAATLFAEKAPWMPIFPGLAISMAVFGFNLFGDSLRDVLDPKLRGR
jgi:peptide/nickel transport system permease protein